MELQTEMSSACKTEKRLVRKPLPRHLHTMAHHCKLLQVHNLPDHSEMFQAMLPCNAIACLGWLLRHHTRNEHWAHMLEPKPK
jgi:hypothetical protein